MPITFAARAPEYRALWDSMTINKAKAVSVLATARKIAAHKADYDTVARETNAPWYVIGIIHAMECNTNFGKHLHNGDPLTAKTVQVPKGRPKTGNAPFSWSESAIDAIRYDGLDKVADWSIERICYELEAYNGWGYARHHPDVNSPYLWAATNQYTAGKYVADGKWSGSAVSQQSGAMALLKALIENGDVTLDKPEIAASDVLWPVAEAKKPGWTETAVQSKSFMMQAQAFLALGVTTMTDWGDRAVSSAAGWLGILPAVSSEVQTVVGNASTVASHLPISPSKVVIPLVLIVLVIAAFRHIRDKREMI